MRSHVIANRAGLLAAAILLIASASLSSADAMPVGAIGGAGAAPLVERASAEQHRVYPGSDSRAAEQARAARRAPNLFCEKHENECE